MKAISRLGTMALLGAVLGATTPLDETTSTQSHGEHPRSRRRPFRKIRGSGTTAHATKKGPGRRGMPRFERNSATGALKPIGRKRLQAAHGPDSINARSGFYRLLGANKLKEAREFLNAMKAYPHGELVFLEIALRQREAG